MSFSRILLCLVALSVAGCGNFFRAIDASNNTDGGQPGLALLRLADANYADGLSEPIKDGFPSPRAISNAVSAQVGEFPNDMGASNMVWQWGQFLDHDIDLSPEASPEEECDIEVPAGDPFFDPFNTGMEHIGFGRSDFLNDTEGVRQQTNVLTSFVDASMVYGSDDTRAMALRALDGTGKLLTGADNFLPFNTAGLPNAGGPSPDLFLAGDVRANEQLGLMSMHTLFMREHNYWINRLSWVLPNWVDADTRYELARMIVSAEIQVITYNEFLPVILGKRAIPKYSGYKAGTNPGIANEFSTAAFRFGHSMLTPNLKRLNRRLKPISDGNIELKDAFFAPDVLINEGGIDPILRGLSYQHAQEVDTMVVDGVRNFLFGPPGSGGFDLASLNIQRGRDHGLPRYNDVRVALGLKARKNFRQITGGDRDLADALSAVYDGNVDNVDLWVGGLAEKHRPGAMVGQTFQRIIADQFIRLRDGDKFWYERQLESIPFLINIVESTKLSDIIKRNTGIRRELQKNVFMVPKRYRKKRSH